MKKFLFLIGVCLLTFNFAFAEQEPRRPSNVPEEAVWEVALWKYYDEKKSILYHWYSNGKPRSKALIKKDKPHGKAEYWSPDGTKIMNIIYAHGVEKKRENYKIVIPDLQRPLNLPLGAIWDRRREAWVYYHISKKKGYMWYINGEKMMKTGWSNNALNGDYIWYFKNGVIMVRGNYKDNIKHGKFSHRSEDGVLAHIEYYKNGRKIWSNAYSKIPPKGLPKGVVWHEQFKGWKIVKGDVQYIYSSDGRLEHKTEMKGFDYHGKTISYFPNGKVLIRGQFIESRKEGKWKYYYRNGQVGRIKTYKNDKVIKTENFKKK